MNQSKWKYLESIYKLLQHSDNDYSEIVGTSETRTKLKFECLLCLPKRKEISCDSSSLSNLRRHISSVHPTKIQMYDELYLKKRKCANHDEPPAKQSKIETFIDGEISLRPAYVPQSELDSLILKHIIDDCQPLTLVRSQSFRNLILRLAPKRHIMCYETLKEKLSESYEKMKMNLQEAFSMTNFVAITADGWSRGSKSFIGITAHWIDLKLKRNSVALACRRIIGRHTYNVIAEMIEQVLVEFCIHNKTNGATTDNGSNFVKAFTLFTHDNNEEIIAANNPIIDGDNVG